MKRKEKVPHLLGLVQDQEILKVLAMGRGGQDFGITSPSTGLGPLGHLPTLIPTLLFTSSFSSLLFPPTLGEDIQKDVPAPRISCPKGSKAYASHCYALFMTPKSWMDADVSTWIFS